MASKDKNISLTLTAKKIPENVLHALMTVDNRAQFLIDAASFYLEHREVPEELLKNKLDTMQQNISLLMKQVENLSSAGITEHSYVKSEIHRKPLEVIGSENEISTKEVEAVVNTSTKEETNIKEVISPNNTKSDKDLSEEVSNITSIFGIEIDED